ncbi:metallophosphoesterase [Sphingomonas sp.]|uniref:metallophosphoesterase family protein n=1 Tax=Sphingomonas sp. TaxID=28214 RepID=UPI0025F6B267|nr:metallophosphoesterase [Sphingomonas sp.]
MGENYKGTDRHVFGRRRPILQAHFPVSLDVGEEHRDTKFRPLPEPTGSAPFRLALESILSPAEMTTINAKKQLTFHLNGDMGGIKDAVPQELVAKGMEKSFDPAADASINPSFLYITGDCVYFNGQKAEYYRQFYEPYEFYPRPIFAVAGNHDGENLDDDGSTSLDGFMRNFCAPQAVHLPEALDSHRTAMIQPNVYWTLTTPLFNIVGLYSNVPEGGQIKEPQLDWYVNELKTLPTNVPLFVALHHPPYSADDHHSGSKRMIQVLDDAAAKAGRAPDMVLAGHVHNYQRLSRTNATGDVTPYLVTGAGGYHNLHHIMKVNHQAMITPVVLDRGDDQTVTLHSYMDDHHGFLVLSVTPDRIVGDYYHVPRPQEPYSKGNQLVDHWEFDWKGKRWLTNDLSGPVGSTVDPAEPVPMAPHGRSHKAAADNPF